LTAPDELDGPVSSALADDRLQRLLTIGQEVNTLRLKIGIATKYIASEDTRGGAENVVLAREVLRRDLERDIDEARELMHVVDKLMLKFEELIGSIEDRKKVHEGLVKIESLSGLTTEVGELEAAIGKDRAQISELENLVAVFDDLGKDLSLRRDVIECPRCYSPAISYRIAPSEMGFSLYRCNKCGNAWRIRQFSMRIGPLTQ
jgi:DNA-directed RNA polymerase subunit M/transcription elongation factor TFIIS